MPTAYPTGTRLRCAHCGCEVILLKSQLPVIECCGASMEATFLPHGATQGQRDE
jgi:hypothetical protein